MKTCFNSPKNVVKAWGTFSAVIGLMLVAMASIVLFFVSLGFLNPECIIDRYIKFADKWLV